MKRRHWGFLISAFTLVASWFVGFSVTGQSVVPAGPNQLTFPSDWDKGVMYATVDRPDFKQYREFYTSPDVVRAAKEGRPLPEGSLITLAAYAAKLDTQGVPVKDTNGRFIKDKLLALNTMQKRAGWGQGIPADIRNGDWIYQSFTPDGSVNEKANLAACYQCHLPFAKDDYLTNLAKLSDKFPWTTPIKHRTGPTEVAISGFSFGPAAIKVVAGQSINWTNADDTPHQITLAGPNGARSAVMLKGQSATLQFDAAGNIAYVCGLHPSMRGTIEVVPR